MHDTGCQLINISLIVGGNYSLVQTHVHCSIFTGFESELCTDRASEATRSSERVRPEKNDQVEKSRCCIFL